ncbi:MFS transporter [Alkalibacillus haloalkaliphilus]|uniref:MFS transporter n=1 Tax=Alkalibacillus haloalkaliphilus TaxID=94136 RepID=A0A511W1A4_9BACI|nr:MFS transporter [Alkalibacillus haloalkaliphilus]GEN44875.1 MFS transporter [Alkalibacillus haloalkaliphilus]
MLLFGIGSSSVGEWVYFIALNLIVLEMTGSPLAVSMLYIIKPLATLCTNLWAGSFIDRLNKKYLMILLDLLKATLILTLPFLSSLGLIYLIVFLVNVASSVFEPTSMTYVTKLIPYQDRKRFNSLLSLVTSGAFLIGPAIAGVLFMVGSPYIAIYINSIALLISAIITSFMPNLEKDHLRSFNLGELSLRLIKSDLAHVIKYSRLHIQVMIIYFLFSFVMIIMASAIDSLEAAFAKEVLMLTDSEYGFLVSIAGAGIVIGAIINSLVVNHLKTFILIGLGTVFVSMGYVIYAFSEVFIVAAFGFFFLAFFIAFANTGFLTFYQNNIPIEVMGRVRSVFGLLEAILIILLTTLLGAIAELYSVKGAVILGVLIMFLISTTLLMLSLRSSKKEMFNETVNP